MNLDDWKSYISETYSTDIEYLWKKYPAFCVFRHQSNNKWFALIAEITRDKLGMKDNELISILNLKLDPMMIDVLRTMAGFYPAYHMNKTSWIKVVLDGTVDEEKIKDLIDISFDLTDIKKLENLNSYSFR